MGFWSLFMVASMPIVQVLLISVLGAFMATDYLNLLKSDARRSLNKIVFVVFTPSLAFACLAKSVRFEDIITWWFMPVNIGITFLLGATLAWIASKIIKPEPHIQNLVMAMCSAGNLGNILLIIIPAICNENGSPFGDQTVCYNIGLSYVTFSLSIGGFYIWTYAYYLIKSASIKYKELHREDQDLFEPSKDLEGDEITPLLHDASSTQPDTIKPIIEPKQNSNSWNQILGFLHQIWEEVMSPPVVAAILGFIFGTVSLLRHLIVGDAAPLRVVYDSVKLLGDGTIPCITLILGGNLTQGLKKASVKPSLIVAVICVRYIILPIIGIGVVLGAAKLGFLPADPLFSFILMIQFTLPPAMNIGTMTQLFEVAQEESSILYLWTYIAATFALTGWSTVFMWILSS
ncbi:protein PIN-LIKES 7-like isoform X1 [Primulina tabacum]|uniref:protein PIN-LIKES 7-like isoform X1 n=1 Tax=Primulina tabacum TaxID=48773 RepID=UPI003F59E116